jgi:hypothetical protein
MQCTAHKANGTRCRQIGEAVDARTGRCPSHACVDKHQPFGVDRPPMAPGNQLLAAFVVYCAGRKFAQAAAGPGEMLTVAVERDHDFSPHAIAVFNSKHRKVRSPPPSPISHLPAPHTLLFLPLVPFIDCVCHAMPCRFLVRLFNFVAPASFSCRVLCSGGLCTGHCCEGALLHARDIKRLPATGGPTATTLFCGRGTGADPSCCGARASG